MKKVNKGLAISLLLLFAISSNVYAGGHSEQSVKHASKSVSHASGSVAHVIMSSGKVASAASAIPFAVVGSVGEVSKQISEDLMDAATAPIGTPLEITEESIVAGPPPNEAI